MAVTLAGGARRDIATGLNGPRFVHLDAKEQKAIVTEGPGGAVALVDLYTGGITRDSSGLSFPLGMDLNCSETTAFVAENGSGELSAVTLSNGVATSVASGLSQPVGVAVKRDDAQTRAIPHEIQALRFDNKTTLSWESEALYAGSGIRYDLLAGDLSEVGNYGAHSGDRCVSDDIAATNATDQVVPAPGTGFFYLVRGNNGCGAGRYQTGIGGVDRAATACR